MDYGAVKKAYEWLCSLCYLDGILDSIQTVLDSCLVLKKSTWSSLCFGHDVPDPNKPFHVISTNMIGPLPIATGGYQYIKLAVIIWPSGLGLSRLLVPLQRLPPLSFYKMSSPETVAFRSSSTTKGLISHQILLQSCLTYSVPIPSLPRLITCYWWCCHKSKRDSCVYFPAR